MNSIASKPRSKTHFLNLVFFGLGLLSLLGGLYMWQAFNLFSGTYFSLLESQGYAIPDSAWVRFKTISAICVFMTLIGFLFAAFGLLNEAMFLFEE